MTAQRPGEYSPPVADSDPNTDEDLGFDELISRLRAVLEKLEEGNLGLEDSLRAYEEGVGLARRGHALLDAAEKRVELLVRGPDGSMQTAPLDGGAGSPNEEGTAEGDGDDGNG